MNCFKSMVIARANNGHSVATSRRRVGKFCEWRAHLSRLRALSLAGAESQHDRVQASPRSGTERPGRWRASRAIRPRLSRPASSGTTTRSTNGSRTRSTSLPGTP